MDAIEVKIRSPTKKRAGGDDQSPGRRLKRQATNPSRVTRSMLKKLNENGGPPVELNPGLEMGVRRRGPRTRPPKRAAQDEAVGGSVKRTSTARKRGAKPRTKKLQPKEPEPKEPEPKEPQPKEPQPRESQPAESRDTEPEPAQSKLAESKPAESKPAEPQPTGPQPEDQERRVSDADVAAASRLAQAAIAAGLTRMTPETGTPVSEDLPSLVRFTKRDLSVLLSEAVVDDAIRQKMEPHWLARTEFLTWWERPAADMDHIKKQVRRLAVRWSKDLQAQNPDGGDIPISMLESWRADIVIVGDPKEDTDDNEAENEGEMAEIDKNRDEKEDDSHEKKDGDTKGEENQDARDQGDEKARVDDSCEAAETLAETLEEPLALAMREMAEWKAAFHKEIATEPNFGSKRAWTARVSASQREVTALEEEVRHLNAQKSEWITDSVRQGVDILLGGLQQFIVGLRMDREAFWDDFNQEGADLLSDTSESDENAGEESGKNTRQNEAREIETDFDIDFEAELEKELEAVMVTEDEVETETETEARSEVEEEKIQVVEVQVEKEHTQLTEIEEHHDLNTGRVSMSETEPTEPSSEATKNDNDPSPTTARPENKPEGNLTKSPHPSEQCEESAPTFTTRITQVESNCEHLEIHPRRAAETYAGESTTGPLGAEEGEKFEPVPAAEPAQQAQEGKAAHAGEETNHGEPITWSPDKNGSQSPSLKCQGRQQEGSEVISPNATAAVEEQERSSREVRISLAADLFESARIEEVSNEGEHTADQTLTCSDITRLPPDTVSVTSSTGPASPEISIAAAENMADSSSTASNISSLPEDPSSSTSGRSETAQEVNVESTEDQASANHNIIGVPDATIFPQDANSSVAGVPTESMEEVGDKVEETVENISPISHINILLQEASMPRSVSALITGVPSRSIQETGGESEETDRNLTTNSPQDTSLATSGIPSGSDMGAGGQAEDTIDDDAPATSDAASLPQGSNAGEDLDAPPSAGKSPVIVPVVRYIKPQWEESLSSPEEPTYDYSANEAEEHEDEGDEVEEVDYADDREADDVDP